MPFDGTEFEKPETVRQLEAAKALIADPANWCKHSQARLADGSTTWVALPSFPEATQHCAIGALYAVGTEARRGRAGDLLLLASEEMGYSCPAQLNNITDHPTVMRMFDRAIELAWEAHRATAQA